MDPKIKQQIDEMNYEAMLSMWRFSPCPHPWFQGETGDYFKEVMGKKRDALSPGMHTAISKSLGWR